ncbi:IS256 family transposase, partial [Streptomyces sp. NPDC051133]
MADKTEPVACAAGDEMVDEVVERLLGKAGASGTALLGEGGLLTEITSVPRGSEAAWKDRPSARSPPGPAGGGDS